MSSQPPQPPQFDWSKTKFYTGVALITMLLGIGIQASLVPTAWWPILFPAPTERPGPQSSPVPVTISSANPLVRQQNVCGVWLSETSRKRYNFICQAQDSFEIYEISDQGLNKNGSGKLTEDGNIEAEFLSLPKNRRAHLKLRLSADGRKMEGSWQGDDPRESGRLLFHRI